MRAFKYEYQSDFARQYFGEGQKKGRAEVVLRLLAARFGQFDEATKAGIAATSAAEPDAIADRLLTAQTLQEALG